MDPAKQQLEALQQVIEELWSLQRTRAHWEMQQ